MAVKRSKMGISCLILVAMLCIVSKSDGLRILGIFPMHGKSHFVMCEALMRSLAAKGHQVDVYSHFPLKKPIPNYKDFSLDGTMPRISNNMTYDFMSTFAGSVSIDLMMEAVGYPVCDLLNLPLFQKLIRNPPQDPPYDVVIVEAFISDCYMAFGRHLNIPMVTIVTTTLFDWMSEPVGNPTNLAVEPSPFSQYFSPMTFTERLGNVLLSTYIKYAYRQNVRFQDTHVEKAFGSGFPTAYELQRDISLTLVNYHHALGGIRPFTPAVVPIAGIHVFENDDELPENVKKFMDESKSGFIYISFGSMVQIETFPKAAIEAFYATFKNIQPVRVVMKIAQPKLLPPGLPSNVITHNWLAQVKVLKHKNIRAFVTHGGLMGTQESIYYGVPMIGFPLFGDQYFNIESYAKRNMAIKLDYKNIKAETFTHAVKEIVHNPKYKKSTEKVGSVFRDSQNSPSETAIFWIEYVVRHGKDALRSPLVDMPWWQASLLDVYGFIIGLAVLVLYILKKLFSCIRALFSSQSKSQKLKRN